jgi:hypothetical protein
MKKRMIITLSALALVFAACKGPAGPQGLQGADGPQGPAGPQNAGGFPVPGTVTLSGTPMVGGRVTAFYNNPGNAPVFYYQWYLDGALRSTIQSGSPAPTFYDPQTADIDKTLSSRVYALGYTGYLESAVTITPFAPPAPTPLPGSYVTGTLTANTDIHWYSFDASGGSYTVEWEHSGTGSTTAYYIRVSAYQSDGTPFFQEDFSSPGTAISGYTGTVYVRVTVGSPPGTGTYHIRVQ